MMPKDMPVTASDAVGRQQVLHGGVSAAQAKALGATLTAGWAPDSLPDGAVLPYLWH